MGTGKLRVAIYIRVSTPGQASEGLSLDEQNRRLTAYCAALGWTEPVLYCDAGLSAYKDNPAARPAFARLLADCETGLIDTIVVAKMSRWARSTLVTVRTLQRFEELGVSLVSLEEKIDYGTPMGRMVTTILASIDQYSSDDKSEDARRIHAYLRSQGKWDGGRPPFGARLDAEGRVDLDPAKAPLLARLLTMAATTPPATIAKVFAEEGIPPPGTGYRWARQRPSWTRQTIARIVRKAGWLRALPPPWPGLVDAAQRRPYAPRVAPAKPVRMLTGLMRCPSGGAVFYGGAGKWDRGKQTVRCRDHAGRPGGGGCPIGHTYVTVYEAQVVEAVAGLATRLGAITPGEAARASPQAAEWAALDVERERLRHEYRVIGARYAAEFEREWRTLEARESRLARESAGPIALVLTTLPLLLRFTELPPADQNEVLRGLTLSVEVAGREAVVQWRPEIAAFLAESSG